MSSSLGFCSTYTFAVHNNPPNHPSTTVLCTTTHSAHTQHPRKKLFYSPFNLSRAPSLVSPQPCATSSSSFTLPASSFFPDSIRIFEWNAGDLCAKSDEFLYFFSLVFGNFVCTLEFNLNFFLSFRIPGYSVLQWNCSYFWSGSLLTNDSHPRGGVAIFVRKGLSFSELSISPVSLLIICESTCT